MVFDKNQSEFISDRHREIWWWAVGIVPPSESLTEGVRALCSEDILEGCYQWHGYFNELCEDMYENISLYHDAPARQYRDILENIASGALRGDAAVKDTGGWEKYREKYDKNEPGKLEKRLAALGRTGLEYGQDSGGMVFCNQKYPKIFHAMNAFEQSPNIKKTPARHHFAHCEFRQLFKSYSANYEELLRRVSGESLEIARAIHGHAKSLKIQRYVHFDTIKYKYKNTRVLHFTVTGAEYPTLRVNIGDYGINPFKADLGEILSRIEARKAWIDQNDEQAMKEKADAERQ